MVFSMNPEFEHGKPELFVLTTHTRKLHLSMFPVDKCSVSRGTNVFVFKTVLNPINLDTFLGSGIVYGI